MNPITVRPSLRPCRPANNGSCPPWARGSLLTDKGGTPAPIPAVRRHFPAPDSPARWTLNPAVMAAFPTMETTNA